MTPTIKLRFEVEFEVNPETLRGEETMASAEPGVWFGSVVEHLFETYNDDASLVAVRYSYNGGDVTEIGIGS